MNKSQTSRRFSRVITGSLLVVAGLALLSIAATRRVDDNLRLVGDLKLWNNSNTTKLSVQGPATQSANFAEFRRGATLELKLAGTNTIATLKTDIGLQGGSQVMTGHSATNIAFPVAYSTPPAVLCVGMLSTNVWVSAITTTNFTVNTVGTTNRFNWLSIGAP